MNVTKPKLSAIAILMLCALLGPVAGLAKDQPGKKANPGVLPPQSRAFGATYGEWAARWWQWMGPIPAEISPGWDTTGEFAATDQSGHVWFLADCAPFLLGPDDSITRRCDIPAGKALFFPVCALPWATIPGYDYPIQDPPIDPVEWTLENLDWIRALMASYKDGVSEMFCEIDGRRIQNLEGYNVETPVFGMYGEDTGWPTDPCYYDACIGDGVYLMLAPLPVGQHTIHFRVVQWLPWFSPETPEGYTRYVDVTYDLTIVPGKHGKTP